MDHLTKEKRSWNMGRIKSSNTNPEISVRSFLHKNGFRYRVNVKELPGKPDIVLKKYNTAVFVNGCYWHRHKNCKLSTNPKTNKKFWKDKFEKNIERDEIKHTQISQLGYKVCVIWECEIKSDEKMNNIIRKIKN